MQAIISVVLVYHDTCKLNTPFNKQALFGSDTKTTTVLFLRSSFGYIGIASVFYALLYIPMGDSTTLLMMSTLWSSVLGIPLLNESVSKYTVMAIPVAFAGLILIVQPSFVFTENATPLALNGVIAALIGSFGAAGAYICVRLLGTTNKVYFAVVTFNQGLGQALYSIPLFFIMGEGLDLHPAVLGLSTLMGVIGTCSQTCMTIGMQREKSALAGVMRMSDILASFVLQLLFTDEKANIVTVGGAVLVVAGVLIILFGKYKESLAEAAAALEYKAVGEGEGRGQGQGQGGTGSGGIEGGELLAEDDLDGDCAGGEVGLELTEVPLRIVSV